MAMQTSKNRIVTSNVSSRKAFNIIMF